MKLLQVLSGFALLAGAAASPQADGLHERVPQEATRSALFKRAEQRASRGSGGAGSTEEGTAFSAAVQQKFYFPPPRARRLVCLELLELL
jgi:hypothetical protein